MRNEFLNADGTIHRVKPKPELADHILKERQPKTHEQLAQDLGVGVDVVIGAIEHLKAEGYQFVEGGEKVVRSTEKNGGTVFDHSGLHSHDLLFGVVSDTHLGSKKERLDELNKVYDIFEREGVTVVYHAGDLTDGWGVYRGQELEVAKIGQQEQIDYATEVYPKAGGITTHFITGNHDLREYERGGADPGVAIARVRPDMKYLGQMTARVTLPEEIQMDLLHPDGGQAYALSYKAQRHVNALSPEDVPNIMLWGHYHTSFYMHYRNVHFLQVPSLKDAGLWEKRKGMNSVVGGWLVEGKISSQGNLARFKPELLK